MTFTYDLSNPDDITRIRWILQDTVEASAAFTDEEIQFAIDTAGSWQQALKIILGREMKATAEGGSFKADWLEVDAEESITAIKDFIDLLDNSVPDNVNNATSRSNTPRRALPVYRSDSLQTEPADEW